jgi:DNA-binding NtrC family response regulator
MRESLDTLIVSSDLENRKSLLHILENLSLNVISCSALSEAEEVLSRQEVPLVFCDEILSDGCYRNLLSAHKAGQRAPRIVVTIRGEWDEYLEAIRLGAFDVVRCPFRPTDIEMVIIHAVRESREATAPHRMIA